MSAFSSRKPAVLFDLDGTLADTAPDLCGALNELLAEHGRAPVPLSSTRRFTSSGARGMVLAGFGYSVDHVDYEQLKNRFLVLYEQRLAKESRLFAGIDCLLDSLDKDDVAWGVVTNKIARFTDPLLVALGITGRAACIVCGDTTPHSKPHPAPLLHAARAMQLAPEDCCYVGDDLRDVQAAKAASMRSVIALYGYLGDGVPPEDWGGDASIDAPLDLTAVLQRFRTESSV